ncbi:GNAT family N-acetyltransferase [Leeia sp. TBRC 13508]|uniref:GNAT family N-acetyltransferase n=1 Tax=Leeia speluncae TaxID=2884804 RepID=A0ABS8D545_9NEIS|nr:GNAT family N-acetyltransferase [Leeia speluncae]MCB6183291.1 GNAT family N-acetyltransferase [Leeia speluncae]
MADFLIRAATPADVASIHQMILDLAEFEQLTHLVVATEQDLHQQLFTDSPFIFAFVVEQAGKVVAFSLCFKNYSTFLGKPGLYLEDLYVQPAARGMGIAKAMLRYLAKEAVARGYGRFEWTVLDWNANAIALYESMGAELMNEWRICRVTGDALLKLAGD